MKPRQILLVDDSHFFIQATREFLSRSGNRILTARSGGEALRLLGRETVDLILMDYHLEDMGGDECCRRIKASGATAGIPLIMLTSAGVSEERKRSREAGSDDCLDKPVERMELLARVRRYLDIPVREHKRAPICVPASYRVADRESSGMVFCLSEGGMFIQGEEVPESGTTVTIRFSIPRIAEGIEVEGEVAWNREGEGRRPAGRPELERGFGVRILSINAQGIDAIRTYIGLGDYLA